MSVSSSVDDQGLRCIQMEWEAMKIPESMDWESVLSWTG